MCALTLRSCDAPNARPKRMPPHVLCDVPLKKTLKASKHTHNNI